MMRKRVDQLAVHVSQRVRRISLYVPLIIIGYGALAVAGIVPSSVYMSPGLFWAIAAMWCALACWQFFAPSRSQTMTGIRLVAFHLLSGLFFVGITGVSTPLIAAWVLLVVATGVYFGAKGMWLSIVSFLCIVMIDSLSWYINGETTLVIYNLAAAIAIILASQATFSMLRVQSIEGEELQRVKAREELQTDRILTLVNNLADAVLSTDRKGVIRVYNAASLSLLDTNDSLNGRKIDEVLPLVGLDGSTVSIGSLMKDARSVIERDDLLMKLPGDESIRLEVIISPVRHSYSKLSTPLNDGYIVIMRDITKAKSLEEERDEFISVVSHELRTPATIVEGTLSNILLMLEKTDVTPATLTSSVETAHDQVLLLSRMINDLSTLSRAERGIADDQEYIDLKELTHGLFDSYHTEADQKGLTFNLDTHVAGAGVKVSRLYLEELLQNFLTNAIKYTKKGSVTFCVKASDDTVEFSVKDTGIGISKADQAKVFDKFYRSEDYRTRETGGTGLGLYVSTKLARKLGTTITLTSRLNHGSTFSFTLPRAHSEQ